MNPQTMNCIKNRYSWELVEDLYHSLKDSDKWSRCLSPSIENKRDIICQKCPFWAKGTRLTFSTINALAEEAVTGVPLNRHRGAARYGLALSGIDRNSNFAAC
jgi:hypothetical protein